LRGQRQHVKNNYKSYFLNLINYPLVIMYKNRIIGEINTNRLSANGMPISFIYFPIYKLFYTAQH
jgi:hypothetical protein